MRISVRGIVGNFLVLAAVCFAATAGIVWHTIVHPPVDFLSLGRFKKAVASVVLDREGNQLGTFEETRRQVVPYEKFPTILIDAFLAAEDHSFFSHGGISFRGVIRSLLVNVYYQRVVQGASSISQQVVRLLVLNNERTFWRKIKEAILALALERQCTKQQILELYLNNIYFGRGIYGVAAAVDRFWGVELNDLSAAQAATLAAVAKSARFYSPLNSPDAAQGRRNIILRSMVRLGKISETAYRASRNSSLSIREHTIGDPIYGYIHEWIRQWAEQQWGRDVLYHEGLCIKTTLDRSVQRHATEQFRRMVGDLRNSTGAHINGALITIDVKTGAIRACIGGYDFYSSQFNRVFSAVRQMGSVFKPILYSAAIGAGKSMRNIAIDEPIELPMADGSVWAPRNWNDEFAGSMTLVKALSTSNNIIAVKTLLEIGVNPVIALAQRCGITRQLHNYPSLALGIAEATPEEVVAAFNVFANYGTYVKPFLIEQVRDRDGKKVWAYGPLVRVALDPTTNAIMVAALAVRMERLKKLNPTFAALQTEAIGKTGSTNGAVTTWFVGSTPDYTTAVYIGRDDGASLGSHVFASQTAFPIWFNLHCRLPVTQKHFYVPPDLKKVVIDWNDGRQLVAADGAEAVAVIA